MKHRVLEFLVREMDFNLFGIEATWAESNDVDRYVHTGHGNPAALLSNLHFWTWDTQEVLDMIEWMRDYNQGSAAGGTISFLGFDMQFSERAMDEVGGFRLELGEAGHGLAARTAEGYVCRRFWNRSRTYATMSASFRADCRAGIHAVYDYLVTFKDDYEAATYIWDFQPSYEIQFERLGSPRFLLDLRPLRANAPESARWLTDPACTGWSARPTIPTTRSGRT